MGVATATLLRDSGSAVYGVRNVGCKNIHVIGTTLPVVDGGSPKRALSVAATIAGPHNLSVMKGRRACMW